MKKSFNRKLNCHMYEIFAGDYHATAEKKIVLSTLLGSCISVCLKDSVAGVVGMNHFMLPGRVKADEIARSEDARYGIHAMEMMINSMMKLGARRNYLQAKVFGGGQVLEVAHNNIAAANIDFALAFLKIEEIPVLSRDVGGNEGRKLFFFPDSFEVYVRRITYHKELQSTLQREESFLERMRRQRGEASELELFNNEGGSSKQNG